MFSKIKFALLSSIIGTIALAATDTYTMDPLHSSANFRAGHMGISFIHGRFNTLAGTFQMLDGALTTIESTVQATSVDTNVPQRDAHLRTADFFDVAQFPTITFKSTKILAVEGTYRVTGDLTLHGVTKSISVYLRKRGEIVDPKGTTRLGLYGMIYLKRSEYGMDKLIPAVDDLVQLTLAFEGIKQ